MPEVGPKRETVREGVELYNADCRRALLRVDAKEADALVTDPPYGLEFMGKEWDHGVPAKDVWALALRCVKPGGYALVFGGSRTYHRMACAVEDAGWEVRDCLLWLYGTGFPKGQGCLKPAYEPILLARRPGKGVLPLGIDGCRIPAPDGVPVFIKRGDPSAATYGNGINGSNRTGETSTAGRYPANVVHDGSPEVLEAFAAFGESKSPKVSKVKTTGTDFGRINDDAWQPKGCVIQGHGDEGTAARFFYCAKASKSERWVMLRCNCQTRIIPAWEKQDQSRSGQTDTTSLKRGICEDDSTDECDSFTSSSGSERTDPCLKGGRSTTSTKTSKTTGSRTSAPLAQQNTSDSTPVANSGAGSGGNLARSASNSSRLADRTGTSPPRGGPSTDGAASAMWPASWKKNVCESCGANLVETSHPTVKPLALMQWLVRLVCPEGGLVLDPFAGSGTTALACLKEGRRCLLIEREKAYCDILRKRVKA